MAGLLTCGSSLPRTFPGGCPVVLIEVAHRLQLRGQSRIWRLLATPHRVPISSRRLNGLQEPSGSGNAFQVIWSMAGFASTKPFMKCAASGRLGAKRFHARRDDTTSRVPIPVIYPVQSQSDLVAYVRPSIHPKAPNRVFLREHSSLLRRGA